MENVFIPTYVASYIAMITQNNLKSKNLTSSNIMWTYVSQFSHAGSHILVCYILLEHSYVCTHTHVATYGTNHPQLKQDTRVVFVSHACCFRGVEGCLATHACGHTRVHAQIVLHTRVPTRTRSVYTRALFASVT